LRSRVLLIALVAAPLVVVDLAQKASEPVYGHPRGLGYVAVALVLCAAIFAFVPRVPSRVLAIAGGIAAAGALGNLVSALAWRNGVPNPIVDGNIAFNLADVWTLAGALALIGGATVHALRHPGTLRERV
jgi:lipoprotein signal peptidase